MGKAVRPLVTRQEIRLAMLGMVEGNGHPYSWSAIFNGYDAAAMASCPYATIPEYLGKQPKEAFGIAGARVTHVWTDDPKDALHVANCSLVPTVVRQATDVIGAVDAVVVATDIGSEHVWRCRPFVEAGLPVFVDKPMVDSMEDLQVFSSWVAAGKAILSSSSMRYTKEFLPYRLSTRELGDLRYVSITTPKTWERYGIHALEAIYPIVGAGFVSARNTGTARRNVVHLTHRSGTDVVVVATADMYGSFGVLTLCGTKDHVQLCSRDTFYAFKAQLAAFVEYLRTGVRPFPFTETEELMRLVVAGIRSRDQAGCEIQLASLA